MAKYSMKHNLLFALFALSACTSEAQNSQVLSTAIPYIGHSERYHREELKDLLDVDPVYTQWCAAFVNMILLENNLQTSAAVSKYPLMARSFLEWGTEVTEPQKGDIVVFKRGSSWQGHVAFYVSTTTDQNGTKYYNVLGGNQDDAVSIKPYAVSRVISIRRLVN